MCSLGFISDETLRNALSVDIYGFYLKDEAHIPMQCVKQYNTLRRERERHILKAFNVDNIPLINPQNDIPFAFRLKSFLLRFSSFRAIYKIIAINDCVYPEIYDIDILKQLLQRGYTNTDGLK